MYNWSDQHSNSNLLCLVISLKKFLSPIFNQEIVLHKNQKIHYTTPLYIIYKGYLIYLISDLLYLYTTVIVFLKKKAICTIRLCLCCSSFKKKPACFIIRDETLNVCLKKMVLLILLGSNQLSYITAFLPDLIYC